MATSTVTGASAFLAKLKRRRELVAAVAAASLYRLMAKVIATSDTIIPVDTGRARSSHFVETPVVSGDKVVVRGGYGALPYILALHENMAAHHPHGQAKFLELALQEHLPGARAWLAADIAEGLRTGRTLASAGLPTAPTGGA